MWPQNVVEQHVFGDVPAEHVYDGCTADFFPENRVFLPKVTPPLKRSPRSHPAGAQPPDPLAGLPPP